MPKPVKRRALQWIVGPDTGLSSQAIWAHMMGAGRPEYGWSHPYDPDDLSRCLRLLRLIPEWDERIPEMVYKSPYWRVLIRSWHEIVESMEDEVGWNWSKGHSAPKTYDLMRSILGAVRHR